MKLKKWMFGAIMIIICVSIAACAVNEEPQIVSISVNSDNAKYYYVSGTEIDPSGLIITAQLEDGTTKTLTTEVCEFVKPAFAPSGVKEVVVKHGDVQTSYPIFTVTSGSEKGNGITYQIRTNENGSKVSLTAYTVNKGKPFVMVFPGGGYEHVYMQQEGYDYAEKITQLGYNAFILEYSVNMEHPAPLNDVAMAYQIIEQNQEFFDVEMDGYAVCGSSAGGHLAATWSTNVVGAEAYGLPRPAAAILAYASTHIYETSRTNLLGENPSEERRKSLSADENIDPEYPATYSWVLEKDELVSEHVRIMEKALVNGDISHITRYFTGGAHGLGLATGYEAEGWLEEAIEFWANSR